MKTQERYVIGPTLRAKLRQMVNAFDGTPGGGGGARIPTAHQEMPGRGAGAGSSSVRLGKINQAWLKGTQATVTQLHGDGSSMEGSPTFTAWNHFADVMVDCGERKVACARVESESKWILLAAECGV